MRSTAELRTLWAPPCQGPSAKIALHGTGVVYVRPAIIDAVLALNAVLVKWNYLTRKEDTGAYNCKPITGGTGYSLHAYKIALDINWSTNPYGETLVTDMPRGMVDEILAIRTLGGKQVWRWGGDFKSVKDAMHFEICCSPRDLAMGLRGVPLPEKFEEDDMARYVRDTINGHYYWLQGEQFRKLSPAQFTQRNNLARLGGKNLPVEDMHPWALADFLMRFQLVELKPPAD